MDDIRTDDTVTAWEKLKKGAYRYPDYQYPKVTVVIPSHNAERAISATLDSVFSQEYPSLEVLVVDAGSTDRTLRIINAYYGDRIRVYSMTGFNLYEMINKGIALAEGEYINFLYPGDLYLDIEATRDVMTLVLDHEKPHLAFGGCLLRNFKAEVKVLFRGLDIKYLKQGKVPTSLSSSWFRKDLFTHLGAFPTDLKMRADLDFLCSLIKDSRLQVVSTSRVYIDQETRRISHRKIIIHFSETLRVIYRQFGWITAVKWLFYQRDLQRIFCAWWRALRLALFGHPHRLR